MTGGNQPYTNNMGIACVRRTDPVVRRPSRPRPNQPEPFVVNMSHILIVIAMIFFGCSDALTVQDNSDMIPLDNPSSSTLDSRFQQDYVGSVDYPRKGYLINPSTGDVDAKFVLPEWEQCPNGTEYVVRRRFSTGNLDASVNRQRFVRGRTYFDNRMKLRHYNEEVLGCCPSGQIGCVKPGTNYVSGCCQEGQRCLYASDGDFLACATHPRQACTNQRCPIGYACCPGYPGYSEPRCMPLPLGTNMSDPSDTGPYDLKAFCGALYIEPRRVVSMNYPVPVFTAGPSYKIFVPNMRELVNETTIMIGNFTPPASLVIDPPQYECAGIKRQRCHIGDNCTIQTKNITSPYNTTIVTPFLGYCCPDNHTLCRLVSGFDSPLPPPDKVGIFLGCANDLLDEECCGQSICATGNKCCRHPEAPPSAQICCPDQMECCYGDVYLAASEALSIYNTSNSRPELSSRAYCGVPINGFSCAMDRQQGSEWYQLYSGLLREAL